MNIKRNRTLHWPNNLQLLAFRLVLFCLSELFFSFRFFRLGCVVWYGMVWSMVNVYVSIDFNLKNSLRTWNQIELTTCTYRKRGIDGLSL